MKFITVWLATAMFAAFPQQHAATGRFDYLVRADFFAGAAGDEARLAKAIELREDMLQERTLQAAVFGNVYDTARVFGPSIEIGE